MMKKKRVRRLQPVSIAILIGAMMSIPVWRQALAQRGETQRLRAEARRVERTREQLEVQQAEWENPARREEILRKAGYVRPGEVRIEGAAK